MFLRFPARVFFALLVTVLVAPVVHASGVGETSVPCLAGEISGVAHGAATQPDVVPRLQTWAGSEGKWVLGRESRIVVSGPDAQRAKPIAAQLAAELETETGLRLPVVVGAAPARHDIAMSLSICNAGAAHAAGDEGYTLLIGEMVSLRANREAGLRYAKTTLLQMIDLSKDESKTIGLNKGYALDYPAFPVRSIMLDVGRLYMRKEFLEDFLRFMSWYKLNTLEVHLNDQAFGVNAEGTAIDPKNPHYFSRSMRLLSSRFPLAAPTDGLPGATTSEGKKGYSREDWEELESVAREYGVTLKPEIDIPAHSGVFLNARPDLELKNVSPQWGGVFDVSNPQSLLYVDEIFDEFLPWFHSAAISVGGDEATPDLTGISDQARATFLAGVVKHVLSKGDLGGTKRTVTMWNDAYAADSALTPLRDSIVIQNWIGKDDEYLGKLGFRNVVDSRSTWYVVPEKNSDSNEQLAKRLYDEWTVNPKSLGGQICEWNDNAALGLNESGVIVAMKDVVPAAGQVLWGKRAFDSAAKPLPYARVAGGLPSLGYGPDVRAPFPKLSVPLAQ